MFLLLWPGIELTKLTQPVPLSPEPQLAVISLFPLYKFSHAWFWHFPSCYFFTLLLLSYLDTASPDGVHTMLHHVVLWVVSLARDICVGLNHFCCYIDHKFFVSFPRFCSDCYHRARFNPSLWREKWDHRTLWDEEEIIDGEHYWKTRKLKECANILGPNDHNQVYIPEYKMGNDNTAS